VLSRYSNTNGIKSQSKRAKHFKALPQKLEQFEGKLNWEFVQLARSTVETKTNSRKCGYSVYSILEKAQ